MFVLIGADKRRHKRDAVLVSANSQITLVLTQLLRIFFRAGISSASSKDTGFLQKGFKICAPDFSE